MKRILLILFVLLSVQSFAQFQRPNTRGVRYRTVVVDSFFALPTDTFTVPSDVQSFNWAARKGTTMYFWNTSTLKWDAGSGGAGYSNLTQFVDQTAWRVFYSNGSGDVTELALGADGTFLKSNGATSAPTFATPSTVATAVPLSGLTAATAQNLISNGSNEQLWLWSDLTTNSTPAMLFQHTNEGAIDSTTAVKVNVTGNNNNAGLTTYALKVENSSEEPTATNVAIHVQSANGTNNYAIIVPNNSGLSGFGTSTPDSVLTVDNGGLFAKRGVRFSGLPTDEQAYLIMADADGVLHKVDTTGLLGGGSGSQTLQQVITTGATLTGDNSITNGANTLTITNNSLAGDNGVSITSNSTAAASNAQVLLNVGLSGANGTSTQTTYAGKFSNTHTGTGAVNIGIQGIATGGSSGYGVYGSSDNIGVYGTTGTANAYGVYGIASADGSHGVHAVNTAATGTGYALYADKSTGAATNNIAGYFTALGGTNNYAAQFARGKISFGTAGTESGILEINGVTSGTVTVKPADAAGTYTLTLPADDGDAGEVLTTDGSGNLSWELVEGGSGITVGTTTITSGTDTRVPFNDGGVYGEDDNFIWNKTDNRLTVGATSGGLGTLTLSKDNTDYTNTSGAGSVLLLKNPNATGQTVVYSEINGTMRAKWRTDYVGNINWVSSANNAVQGHQFFINGDYPGGTMKMAVVNGGVSIGSWTGGSPSAATANLTVYGSTIINEDGVSTGDVRIEGDTDADLFVTDASIDKVGISTNAPTSTFHIAGSFATQYTATATGIVLDGTHSIVNVTATGQTITLPTAAGITGRQYTIKLTASGSCTVDGDGTETIDGASNYSLSAQYKYVTVVSDGANWIVTANN